MLRVRLNWSVGRRGCMLVVHPGRRALRPHRPRGGRRFPSALTLTNVVVSRNANRPARPPAASNDNETMILSRLAVLLAVTCLAVAGCAGEVTAPAAEQGGTELDSEWVQPAVAPSDTTGGAFTPTGCNPEDDDPESECGENNPVGGG